MVKAIDTVLTKEQMRAINDNMPGDAKYGEVFEAIAIAQAEITGEIMLKQGRKEVRDIIIEDTKNFQMPLSLGLIAKLKDLGL